ncbi:hypothetical protein G7L40_00375 [Paenibacillus polymyxa]|uniref:Uncharacterized protein n=1 Tax=Paenibacillus polymyxa TaxID=1406 RepID=A0A378XW51_PAEPO|nr:hypothetical protein [Paenibacillus polymyxa]MBE7897165.1 hypothetical protein [Paenibacillus polymyxa]MBG9763022.1 hypothetical protein [Paenibacillus polymyxa]MCC3257586.1 hypothetical protein [Paenibacillus polymyxa]QPK51331.1 hypothetical protein G7035_00375 [Paenibacillus polymyxa]QPK56421.1 hypothetical protein G7L40_00375 [Paenibacillus polymyxa]
MKDKLVFGNSLLLKVYEEINKQAELLLLNAIEESKKSDMTYIVDIGGINQTQKMVATLIDAGLKNNICVVLGRGAINPYKRSERQKYIYKESDFNLTDPSKRPNEILVSANVDIDNLALSDKDRIVGGFMDHDKYRRKVERLTKLEKKLRREVKRNGLRSD